VSRIYEECITVFFIRCADIGLNCDCIIYGNSQNKAVNNTIAHMHDYHAISPEEMTTCMKLKINENVHKLHTNELNYLTT
jgi:predicted small metal-binding protein